MNDAPSGRPATAAGPTPRDSEATNGSTPSAPKASDSGDRTTISSSDVEAEAPLTKPEVHTGLGKRSAQETFSSRPAHETKTPRQGIHLPKIPAAWSISKDTSRDEADAVAALEQIKASGIKAQKTEGFYKMPSFPGAPGRGVQADAINSLAKVLQAQQQQQQTRQSLSLPQNSPFQDKPSSPSKLKTVEGPPAEFRHCYSEPSSKRLNEMKSKASGGIQAASMPGDILRAMPPQLLGTLLANPNLGSLGNLLAATSPVLQSLNMPQRASNIASDTHFDISALLGPAVKPPAPTVFEQNLLGRQPGKEVAAEALKHLSNSKVPKHLKGGFGSIIPSDPDILRERMPDVKGKHTPDLVKLETGVGGWNPGQKPPSIPACGVPDPQILDWVLQGGPRANSDKDRAAGNRLPQAWSGAADVERFNTPGNAQDQTAGRRTPAGVFSSPPDPASTLLKPIPIRASSNNYQDAAQNDRRAESIVAKLHQAVNGNGHPSTHNSSNVLGMQQPSDLLVSSGELGRVVQWAGNELAIRDNKVRDVERQMNAERQEHDMAMNAVAAEAGRIKQGQAELAKLYTSLQEQLARKSAELDDKSRLLSGLGAAMGDISQQYSLLSSEVEKLREENQKYKEQLGINAAKSQSP